MKKLISLALAVLLLCSLTVMTWAAETTGFYDPGTMTGAELSVDTNPEKLNVTLTAPTAGKEYLVLLVSGTQLPTAAAPIRYIDQKTASSGALKFVVYPTMTASDDSMTVFLTSDDPGFATKSASVKYRVAKPTYTLGDVNGENGVTAMDASLILQSLVNKYTLDETAKLAADVNRENGVTAMDASLILQSLVNKYVIQ